jgi:hypothetical protein
VDTKNGHQHIDNITISRSYARKTNNYEEGDWKDGRKEDWKYASALSPICHSLGAKE